MRLIYLIVFVIILGGCGVGKKSHQTSESENLQQGFDLVDQGRFEDAILYFQALYDSKPSDNVLKGWASVYVARAGLKVSSLYKVFTTLPSETKLTQENILSQAEAYRRSLEKIPYVKGEARQDLQTAASILQSRNSSTVRLFRAIVNLVLLRSSFSDGDKLLLNANAKLEADKQKDLKILCKLDWQNLRVWLQGWTLYGLELKEDLDLAFPSKKKNWVEGEKFFRAARSFSTTVVRTCDP